MAKIKIHPNRWATLLCALLLAACGSGDGGTVVVPPDPQEPPNPFETAPSYVKSHDDFMTSILDASVNFSSQTILCATLGVTDPIYSELTSALVHPQEVEVGQTSGGVNFLMVVGLDLTQNTSAVEVFVDTNADGHPDQATRTTVATFTDAHVTSASYVPATGTLVVGDSLNNRIWRILDSNADLMPDAVAPAPYEDGSHLPPTGFTLATVHAISDTEIRAIPERGPGPNFDYLMLVDSNADGTADTVQEREQDESEPDAPFGMFARPFYVGETTVEVFAPLGKFCRIECVNGGGAPEDLGTFYGALHPAEVTLNRAIASGDQLRVKNLDDNVEHDEITATETNVSTTIELNTGAGATLLEGDDVSFSGFGYTGSEVVEARIGDTGSWTGISVTGWTPNSVSFIVPDFPSITDVSPADVTFRLRPVNGDEFHIIIPVSAPSP